MRLVPVHSNSSNNRLIMLWAGWGMDQSAFAGLSLSGYDISVIYDYREDETRSLEICRRYDEIVVIAWSMGVYMASRWLLHNPGLPVTRCLAVNGTISPIDDLTGIPPRIYDLTSTLPDERSLRKFYMRICGGAKALSEMLPELPSRSLDELRDELHSLRHRIAAEPIPPQAETLWDVVCIGDSDLIFPPGNMLRAWKGSRATLRLEAGGAHMPNFQKLIFDNVIDKDLVGRRFAGASGSYAEEARVQANVAYELCRMSAPLLSALSRDAAILEVGAGDGTLTRNYIDSIPPTAVVTREDLYPIAPFDDARITDVVADSEQYIRARPPESLDAVLSSSTIQWFNSPLRYLREISRVLRPGGFAALAYYGPGTFAELENINGLCYPEIPTDIFGDEIKAAVRRQTLSLHFKSPVDALRHISNTGVNAINSAILSVGRTRRLLQRLSKSDGSATLTFVVHYLTIKKNG